MGWLPYRRHLPPGEPVAQLELLEGEGLMEIDGETHVVRKHDFIFLPPGVDHSIANTGLVDLVFLVVTSPVSDE